MDKGVKSGDDGGRLGGALAAYFWLASPSIVGPSDE